MALPQDISPINPELMDTLVKSKDMDWIPQEMDPERAFLKVLWTCPETGRWLAHFKWLKGFVAPQHKHLSAAHTFVLYGKLQVRDGVLETGDYVYERNGMIHGVELREGKANWYRNRWVRTPMFDNPGVDRLTLALDTEKFTFDHAVSAANTHIKIPPNTENSLKEFVKEGVFSICCFNYAKCSSWIFWRLDEVGANVDMTPYWQEHGWHRTNARPKYYMCPACQTRGVRMKV